MVHPGTDVFCRNVGIWGHVPWVVGRLQVRSRDSEVIRLVRDRLQRGTGASRMGRLTVAKGGGIGEAPAVRDGLHLQRFF